MDDRRALLAAIVANPAEDTPRLALADWLQEHGDKHDQARAEFIRLQIQSSKPKSAKARLKLSAAAGKIEQKHRKAWLEPLADIDPKLVRDNFVQFSRGLLWNLWLDTGEFLLNARQAALPDALAAVGVEELSFHSPTKRVADFVGSQALRWVSRIQYPGADDKTLGAIAGAPNCAHLSGISFQEVCFTDTGLKTFAKSARTSNLRNLTISNEGGLTTKKPKFTAAGVLALLNSERLPLLDNLFLDVSSSKFDVRPLFADPGVEKLKTLWLAPPTRVADVVASRHLKNLTALILHDAEMTDADAEALLASETLAKLDFLSVALPTLLAPATEKKLQKRFGDGLTLEYDEE